MTTPIHIDVEINSDKKAELIEIVQDVRFFKPKCDDWRSEKGVQKEKRTCRLL